MTLVNCFDSIRLELITMKKKALDALNRLLSGNVEYLNAKVAQGDVSPDLRQRLCDEGQKPYAAIVACSDSRVVPEDIFMRSLGELFVIRVAGNVIGETQAASVTYAVQHLGVPLVMVLGHTHCGAISAVLEGCDDEALNPLSRPIANAIGSVKDPDEASALNAVNALKELRCISDIAAMEEQEELLLLPALYHTDSGKVEVLEEDHA